MARATLTRRVEVLEQTGGELAGLPARLDRVERVLREEICASAETVRSDLREEIRASADAVRSDLREEIRASADAVRSDLRGEIRDSQTTVLAAMREGDENTRRYMRVLYEDLVSRIAAIGEAR